MTQWTAEDVQAFLKTHIEHASESERRFWEYSAGIVRHFLGIELATDPERLVADPDGHRVISMSPMPGGGISIGCEDPRSPSGYIAAMVISGVCVIAGPPPLIHEEPW